MEATWVTKFPLSSAALTNYPPPITASLPISRRTLFRSSESRHWVSYGIHSVTHYPLPKLTRRLFLPSVSGIWDAITGGDKAREAVLAVRRGMLLFRQGDVVGSLAEFDKAIELDPRQKACRKFESLWILVLLPFLMDELGVSFQICGKGDYLFTIWTERRTRVNKLLQTIECGIRSYAIRFEEGAEQFRLDVAMNPNDTEESIWCFLCEAQLFGVHEARKQFLEVGRDPRPVMREAYNMFRDGGDPEKLHFPMAARMSTSTPLYTLDFTMNARKKQIQLSSIWLQLASLYMGKNLMTIWLLLLKFTVNVEIGALTKRVKNKEESAHALIQVLCLSSVHHDVIPELSNWSQGKIG
ncbi:unnamed protein product [Linum tenue]|uniref:Uncharacterized protein n=1 Tax=Linum tenue TaxID=586396 RepID=A0AAV0R4W6_9ROSI|nr:unnamed protein product [Linum tenue]